MAGHNPPVGQVLIAGPSGEIGRHIGLKIRRFVNNGHTSSSLVSGTTAKNSEKCAIFHFKFSEMRNFCAFRPCAKTQKIVAQSLHKIPRMLLSNVAIFSQLPCWR